MYITDLPPIIVLTNDDRQIRFHSLLFLPPTEMHQAIIITIFDGVFFLSYGVATAELLPGDVQEKNVDEKDYQTTTGVPSLLILLCTFTYVNYYNYYFVYLTVVTYKTNVVRLFIILLCALFIILTGNHPEEPLVSYYIIIIFTIKHFFVSSSDYYVLLLSLVLLSKSELYVRLAFLAPKLYIHMI